MKSIKIFKKYQNLYARGFNHGFFDIILWKLGYYTEKIDFKKAFEKKLMQEMPFDNEKPFVLWIGHSTFFIKIDDISILTDPIWSKKCSPFFWGPKRFFKPPISMESLKKLDYILISHNHYDHLDKATAVKLNSLFPDVQWIVPEGLKKWFKKRKIKNVLELSRWQNINFKNVKITAVPSQHFSGRGIFDYNKSLWLGYIFEKSGKNFYFAGDTGYNSYDFKYIGKRWKQIDLSLIPIGAYVPKKILSSVHISPKEAVAIHKEINSKLTIGMHWNTFRLSDEPKMLPFYELCFFLEKEKIDGSFITSKPGKYINW